MSKEPRTSTTIAEALATAAAALENAGVDNPRLTANVLLGYILGIDRTQLLIKSRELLNESGHDLYLKLIARRVAGEPLQYITGHQEFYGLDFIVTPDVLIPRPETEFLVEQVIKLAPLLKEQNSALSTQHSALTLVDVGTGSGCIAVTLAHHLQDVKIWATDISAAALAIARENTVRHSVESSIEFLEGNLLAPLAGHGLENAVDFIVSNPPYIPLRDLPALQVEVRDFEPYSALFAEEDGLLFYKRLLEEGHRYLKPGAYLICEIGYAQLEPLRQQLDQSIWQLEAVTHVLQGIARVLTIRKNT
jgi:release factor glutamine methyltransferase